MRGLTIVLLVACLASMAAHASAEKEPDKGEIIQNGGFEPVDSDGIGAQGWTAFNSSTIFAADSEQHRGGAHGLSLKRKLGSSVPATVVQKVALLREQRVPLQLSAWIKGGGDGKGISIFLRQTTNDLAVNRFAGSRGGVRAEVDGWELHTICLLPSTSISELLVGVSSTSNSTIWIDDMSLTRLAAQSQLDMSSEAASFLEQAFSKIQSVSIYGKDGPWSELRQVANCNAKGARTAQAVLPAIQSVLNQLGDGHSYLIQSQRVRALEAQQGIPDVKFESSRTDAGIGIVSVPAIVGNSERLSAYSTKLSSIIADLAKSNVCGWVLDLRSNSGGSLSAMLGGLSPLLGNGHFGTFRSGSSSMPWGIKDGTVIGSSTTSAPALYGLHKQRPPIAVLIGRGTRSSGEIAAVSLKSLKESRLFGEATAGQLSVLKSETLTDGTLLAIMSHDVFDQTGKSFPDRKLHPDVELNIGSPSIQTLLPPDIVRWIQAAGGCEAR